MARFTVLKTGVNEELINKTKAVVEGYMDKLFHDYEIVQIDDFYTFTFGTVTVTIQVLPWHSDDVLVKVYSYLAEDIEINPALTEELLRLNANIPFGGFGLAFDGTVSFSYSLAGKNLDLNEFEAAVQMVAKTADEYDDLIQENKSLTIN